MGRRLVSSDSVREVSARPSLDAALAYGTSVSSTSESQNCAVSVGTLYSAGRIVAGRIMVLDAPATTKYTAHAAHRDAKLHRGPQMVGQVSGFAYLLATIRWAPACRR